MIGRKIPRKKAPRSSSDSEGGRKKIKKTKGGRKKIKPRVSELPNATGADPTNPCVSPSVLMSGSGSRLHVTRNVVGGGGLLFDIYVLPSEDAVSVDDLPFEDAHLYGDEEYNLDEMDGVEFRCKF